MGIFDWLKILLTSCTVIDEALEDCIHNDSIKEDLDHAKTVLLAANKAVNKLQACVDAHEGNN